MYLGRINQFWVESELALPCDQAVRTTSVGTETLQVRRAKSPLGKVAPAPHLPPGSVRFHRTADGVLTAVDDRITMFIPHSGQSVDVQTRDEHLSEAALYVLGSAMALCTALRGDVPLHASSVELDGHRIGFMAPCGTGKSTTLWEFLQAGAFFANDDLIPVRLEDGVAYASSAISLYPKVGTDLMARYSRDWSNCREILPGRGKFWFPISKTRRASESEPLSALFALQPLDPVNDEISIHIERQNAMQSLSLLASNSMTGTIVPSVIGTPRVMANFARLAAAVPVYTVRYPKRFDALPAVVSAVREMLAEQVTLTSTRIA